MACPLAELQRRSAKHHRQIEYLQQIADSVEAIAAAAERIAQELEQHQQGGQY